MVDAFDTKCSACAVKYIARSAHKGKRREDLEKARWYLDREIGRLGEEILTGLDPSKERSAQ